MTRRSLCALALLSVLPLSAPARAQDGGGLLEARAKHTTKLRREVRDDEALDLPAHPEFTLVRYPTKLGEMAAYLGRPAASAGKKAPVMVWVTGGFPPGGIGEAAWTTQDPDNDQSAQAFRKAGMLMLYPTFRGSFGNPGRQETLYGEVDDLLAAIEFARKLEGADPERVFLGGHSTGGTLVLLAAAAGAKVRGVLSFGPIDDLRNYGADDLLFDPEQEAEWQLRAPVRYLGAISTPTLVIEGEDGNSEALEALRGASKNAKLRFVAIKGADHFGVLAPLNQALAARVSGQGDLELTEAALQAAFDEQRRAAREADDLRSLAGARERAPLEREATLRFYLYSYDQAKVAAAAKACEGGPFQVQGLDAREDDEGDAFYVLTVTRKVRLDALAGVFKASSEAAQLARRAGAEVRYGGWEASD